MQAGPWATYSSYAAIVASSATSVNCRAIWVGGAGNVVVASKVGGTLVSFAALANTLLPIELNQGIVDATSTATLLIALQ